MVMVHIGKIVKGPKFIIPRFFVWGGFLFINFWKWSIMIPIAGWIIREAAIWGIDLIGD